MMPTIGFAKTVRTASSQYRHTFVKSIQKPSQNTKKQPKHNFCLRKNQPKNSANLTKKLMFQDATDHYRNIRAIYLQKTLVRITGFFACFLLLFVCSHKVIVGTLFSFSRIFADRRLKRFNKPPGSDRRC